MMHTSKFEVKAYNDQYKQQIIEVWEESVLATHHFLALIDFDEIKEAVQAMDFNALHVYCLFDGDNVIGFVGVAERKIEMLFLKPNYFGLGLGKLLINFATVELAADKVDVNEQNVKAVKFYQGLGFETFERRDKDDQGRNYPLLRMRRRQAG